MTRTYKRKSEKGQTAPEVMQRAVNLVVEEDRTVRSVAKEYDICHVTLGSYVKKYRNGETLVIGYKRNRQVFNDDQEVQLENYIRHSANIYFGLTPKELRSLAYEWAKMLDLVYPVTWDEKEMAGLVLIISKKTSWTLHPITRSH